MRWLFDHVAPCGETGLILLWVGACYLVALGYRLTHRAARAFDATKRRFEETRQAREAATRRYR